MAQQLTREQAIELVGIEKVEEVECMNCEYKAGNERQEWTAGILVHRDGFTKSLDAHYFVSAEEFVDANGEDIEDLGAINWKISYWTLE